MRRWRIIPYQIDHEQYYTLVEEQLLDGVVMYDDRKQLSSKEFEQLKIEINEVKPGRYGDTR